MSEASAGKIVQLMKVPSQDADLQWLQDALNSAIKLELSTLPPYLCGFWSIVVPAPPPPPATPPPLPAAAQLILSIVFEEMIHMALACNMLTAIGGTPEINVDVPTYPTRGLPGGVRPDLEVYLSGLSREFVKDLCMGIELPEHKVTEAVGETYPTIGAFYDRIQEVFDTVRPHITGKYQLTTGFSDLDPPQSVMEIMTLADVSAAIATIKEQGEGSSTTPDDAQGEFAHYYKFGEIFNGRKLVQQLDGAWDYTGGPVPFPDVYAMARVPSGGWPSPAQPVQILLDSFNSAFKQLLDALQKAWTTSDTAEAERLLQGAVDTMFNLQAPAVSLMQTPLPDASGNYGPEFIYPS